MMLSEILAIIPVVQLTKMPWPRVSVGLLFNKSIKLLAIFNQNEETLMRIELQNEKAVKQVELENTKVITKWEYENERLLKKIDRGIEVKERSQIVAELFTLWMQTAPGSSNKALLPDEFAKMNRYSFECAII